MSTLSSSSTLVALAFKKLLRSAYYAAREGQVMTMTFPAEMTGRRWMHSRNAGLAYAGGTYEANLQDLLRRHLTSGDLFWDIGAHVGFVSLFAIGLVGPTGSVVSFEPHPSNFAFLQSIQRLNPDIGNWLAVNCALGDAEGVVCFKEGKTSTTGAIDKTGSLKVACKKASGVWQGQGRPRVGLIKIDVEGNAGGVLRGAASLLEVAQPTLLVELHSQREAAEVLAALPGSYRSSQLSRLTADVLRWETTSHVLLQPSGE